MGSSARRRAPSGRATARSCLVLCFNFVESSEGARRFVESRIDAHQKKDFFDFGESHALLESHVYVRSKRGPRPGLVRIHDVHGHDDQRLGALVEQRQSPGLAGDANTEIAKFRIDRVKPFLELGVSENGVFFRLTPATLYLACENL